LTEQIGIIYDFTRCFEWQYVISGANGNTGSIIANSLLSKGKKVRIMGRDAGDYSALWAKTQKHSRLI